MTTRFAVLGPVRVWHDDGEIRLGAAQQRLLLALLMAHAGRPVPLEELIDALWGESPPSAPANAVYRHVGVVRRLLEPDLPNRATGNWLLRDAAGYRLNVTPDNLDLLHFRDLLRQNRHLEALALRTGPTATGIPTESRTHPAFTALEREYVTAVKEAAATLEPNAELLAVLHHTASENPLDEPLQAHLIQALAATGQRAEAWETWQQVRATLNTELGVQPGPELQEAVRLLTKANPTHPGARGTARPAPTGPTPAQLPPDLPTFAARRQELAQITTQSTTRIALITGMGGIGKTTLAIHWSHRASHRYPDGQLYADLHGFDPTPTDPAQTIRTFLEGLGIPPHRIPTSTEAQTGLYRTLLAKRRVLILLDNARDAEQVRPLLPGTPGCLVVVTSRDRLFGLVTAEAASPLALGLLSPAEARESLARRLGAERLLSDPDSVAEIVVRCAGLPLALAVVATRAAAHPHFPLAAIAEDLRTAHGGLDAFTADDPAADVRAVFSWSYRALSPGAARLLRLLSLHPGPDVTVPAAAAATGEAPAAVRPLLTELTRSHLLTEHLPGRYVCHDLLRAFARERAGEEEKPADREAVVRRLLDHHLHTAYAAGQLYSPFWRLHPPPPAAPGARPGSFADDTQALRWYTAERQVLRAVAEAAAARGAHAHVWGLAWALERFMDRQGHWHDGVALQRAGLHAAVRDGHRGAEAHLHRGLARASARLKRYDDARAHIRRSLDLFTELGDRLGLGHAHRSHGWLLDRLGEYEGALDAAGRALDLYRAVGDRAAESSALHALGATHALRGEHRRAAAYFEEALTASDGPYGTRYGMAGVWDSLGLAHHHLGEHRRAITCFDCALRLYREVGDTFSEAATLRLLGDTYLAMSDPGATRLVWDRAATLLDTMDPTAAGELRTRLHALGNALPPPRLTSV
ncbi:tetratricopeptide repeat protein [Streptomyces sp. NPDC047072]|uniref:AfsR/SARP family transcriptional regulator n=1 Tax=Streptomyces sp. NPDC047072 TaxID=3154809 RepID=UPI0033C4FDB5